MTQRQNPPVGSHRLDQTTMVLHRGETPDLSMVYTVNTSDIVGFLARFPVDSPNEWRSVHSVNMTETDFSKNWGEA